MIFANTFNMIIPFSIPKLNEPYYFIILIEGQASFSVDFNTYAVQGKQILFLTPYQLLQ
jgi:hypothetical protein